MPLPLAHQTWFEDPAFDADWGFAGETETHRSCSPGRSSSRSSSGSISTRWNGIDVKPLAAMAPYMPFAVRLHLAVCLVGLLALGVYLSPAMDLALEPRRASCSAPSWRSSSIGMASGHRARAAALLLVIAGPLGMLEFGVRPVLQRIDVLGLALFVWFAGPGRWSADYDRGEAPSRTRTSSPHGRSGACASSRASR